MANLQKFIYTCSDRVKFTFEVENCRGELIDFDEN